MIADGVFLDSDPLAIDTETTGVDFHHDSVPYFVTTCNARDEVVFWEWDVDPLTRKVNPPEGDIDEIAELLSPNESGCLVLQNAKFDVAALRSIREEFGTYWRWDCTVDTLIAGHLLASALPHDLTSQVTMYCGVNIDEFDHVLRVSTLEARRYAKTNFPEWRQAKKGDPGMPSITESGWKVDGWMPRAIAKEEDWPQPNPFCNHRWVNEKPGQICSKCGGHRWWIVLRDYANVDSAATVMLWKAQRRAIRRRKLRRIFEVSMERMRLAYEMENRGITANVERIDKLSGEYREESSRCKRICERVAEGMGFKLTLPKGSNNKQLEAFSSSEEGLDLKSLVRPEQAFNGKGGFLGKKGQPLLNQTCMAHYEVELVSREPRGKRLLFLRTLMKKRKRDTALTYMDSYRRFWRPVPGYDDAWKVLFPSLNPTGTNTLRWSSSNPNEQNISKKEGFNLRYGFGPLPGRVWYSIDAQNIELRLPAYEAEEEEMIALFERPDDPPYFGSNHLLSAHVLFPEEFDACVNEDGEIDGRIFKSKYKSTLYQWTKNGNFAVQYGAVPESGTADRAYHVKGGQLKIQNRFRKLKKLNHSCIRFAEHHGYVETIPDVTVDPKRGYPIMCTRTERGRIKPTVPLNYHIQGTAMWWMMKAMIRCDAYLSTRNERLPEEEKAWMVMQVHDELVFDLPANHAENDSTVKILIGLMEEGGDDIGIPTPCSAEMHRENWSIGEDVKLEAA